MAVDSSGDVILAEANSRQVVELPKTPDGYGPQITLPFTGLSDPVNVAVDSAGDVYVNDPLNYQVLELPKETSGYGPQVTLPFVGLGYPTESPSAMTVDSAGDVFLGLLNYNTTEGSLLELPRTASGYGPQVALTFTNPGDRFIRWRWTRPETFSPLDRSNRGMPTWWSCRRSPPAPFRRRSRPSRPNRARSVPMGCRLRK